MTAIICVGMLAAAVAAGLAIRRMRADLAVQGPVAQAESPAQPAHPPDVSPQHVPQPTVEQEAPPAAVEDVPQDMPEPEPQQVQPQMARQWGGPPGLNLFENLTEEERARLREGFMAMFQRFQNMPEEERQAQMARFNAMRQRFENMSDQERQQAMGRIQQQIEQWRQNGGSVEDLFNSISLD